MQPTILMCPPDHFGIEYEINPWMSTSKLATPESAQEQWKRLRETLERFGAKIELMQPIAGLPDLVFTANAGLVFGKRFISSRFRHDFRAGETPHFDSWFASHGFEVEHLSEELYFEGAGDALFCGDSLFAGYRIRSDAAGHQELGKRLGIQVLPMELVDRRFYHLDTCFCPLSTEDCLFFPGAFDNYGKRVLRSHIPNLIKVSEEEAMNFACNAVVVGKNVVMNSGCPVIMEQLTKLGYEPEEVGLGEFLKSGGSAKCLTIRLDGEDAASWRKSHEA